MESLECYSGYSESRSNNVYIERVRNGQHDAIPRETEEIAFCLAALLVFHVNSQTIRGETNDEIFGFIYLNTSFYLGRVIFTYVYFLPQLARVRTFVTRNTSAFERRLRVILRETYVHYRTSYQVRLGFASNGIVVSTVRALATNVFSCPLFLFPSSSCIFTLAQFVGQVGCST